jgi:hypothetical protein
LISRPCLDLADSETNEKWTSVLRNVGLPQAQREGKDCEFSIAFDMDLNHNAMSTKDRSSLFDGKMISKPDERIGGQILEWLNKGVAPEVAAKPALPTHALGVAIGAPTPKVKLATPLRKHLASAEPSLAPRSRQAQRVPMFNGAGELTGEKETAAMLEAVTKATTFDRLLSIDKSRRLGFDTNRLTLDQARTIREAIDKRQAELASSGATKAA